nr:formylglycine-generating enzyme family protein [Deltaproteobacteria bacterium]
GSTGAPMDASEGGGDAAGSSDDGGGDSSASDDGEIATVDLTEVYVRVPVATIDVVPGALRVPWVPIGLASLALVAFIVLLRSKPRGGLLPAAADHAPTPTRWGRAPPRGPPLRRVLLDHGERNALVWGITRKASQRPTDKIDVARSIDATIATGIPTLHFHPAHEYRGVWIWRDTEMGPHAKLAHRLETELRQALEDAGLPVQVAQFDGLPRMLYMGPRTLVASSLLDVGRPPRVVVLTNGEALARGLREAPDQARTQSTVQMLRRWEGLAVVDFAGERSELAVLARRYGLRRVQPEHAAAHLVGDAPRAGHVLTSRDLLRWEVACMLAPRSIDENDAQRLRRALGLAASPFDIETLRARVLRGGRLGRSRLDWTTAVRVETFARLENAHGYLDGFREGAGATGFLPRALDYWQCAYDEALTSRGEDRSDTTANLEIERAIVGLWREPEKAADTLYRWWQVESLRDAVTELVSRHTDVDGPASSIRLPWRYGDLEQRAQLSLARMGLSVEGTQDRVVLGGRRALGLTLLVGCMAGALVTAVRETGRPTVELVGEAPAGSSVECDVASDWRGFSVHCGPTSRYSWAEIEWGPGRRWGMPSVAQVSWALEEVPCERTVDGLSYLMCDARGERPWRSLGWHEPSRVAVVGPGARAIAEALLRSGSVDLAVFGGTADVLGWIREHGADGRFSGGEGLVVVGKLVVDDVAAPWQVVRVPKDVLPNLDFAGAKPLVDVWPGATVVQEGAAGLDLVGNQRQCPSGMAFVDGGEFDGHTIQPLCLDVTEVQVSSYEACLKAGHCTEAGKESGLGGEYSGDGSCNRNHEGRGRHPMNCVDWTQAKAFCTWAGKRLPNQSEWEWAARGRDEGRTYPWGEEAPTCERVVMDEGGNGCGKDRTWPVGSKPKGNSRDGVKDMAGNVWEWTSSGSDENRVVRGGSWFVSFPSFFRADDRDAVSPSSHDGRVGFRCARTSVGSQDAPE